MTTLTGNVLNRNDLNGVVVTWDTTGAEVELQKILDGLSAAGIKAKTELRQTSAFTRAIKALNDGKKNTKIADKLKGSAGVSAYQLTDKAVDVDSVTYTTDCNVHLDVKEGKAHCDNEHLQDEINANILKAHSVRTPQDISLMVKKLFQDNADLFPINPRKGVAYFVPDEHKDFAKRINTFLEAVGGVLWVFPVPKGDPKGDQSVKDAIDLGMKSLLDDLEDSVAGWGENTGHVAIRNANNRWAVAAAKIEAYKGYLQDKHEALTKRLEDAKEDMQQKIKDLGAETE